MFSIKSTFKRAATGLPSPERSPGYAQAGHGRVSLFVLALMVLAIDDDRQREERRSKREGEAKARRKPPGGPRPC